MKVIWTFEARQDRRDTFSYIAEHSPLAAVQMDELFEEAAARLESYARLGRVGKIAGTREIVVHENYMLVYEVDEEEVRVLALVHTSRQWPPVER
jgi:toxin ParE1/3/4